MDFGFYGKGLSGYLHYKQAFDRSCGPDGAGPAPDPVQADLNADLAALDAGAQRVRARPAAAPEQAAPEQAAPAAEAAAPRPMPLAEMAKQVSPQLIYQLAMSFDVDPDLDPVRILALAQEVFPELDPVGAPHRAMELAIRLDLSVLLGPEQRLRPGFARFSDTNPSLLAGLK